MTQQKKIVTQFSYKVDQASITQAVQANNAVAASFGSVQDATKTFSADVLALNPKLQVQLQAQLKTEKLITEEKRAQLGYVQSRLKFAETGERAALRLAATDSGTVRSGLLAKFGGDSGMLVGFQRDLADIQAREAASASQQLQTEKLITEEQRVQLGYVQNRLKFAETGDLAALRLAVGTGGGIAPNAQQAKLELQDMATAARTASFLGGGGSRTLGQGVTAFGRGLFNAPDIGGVSTPIARGLIGGGAAIDALGLSVGGLVAGAAIAAPAILLLVAATSAYGKTAEQATERAKTFSSAFAKALEAGTTAQVLELVKRQENDIVIAEATRTVLQQKAEQSQGQLVSFLEGTSDDLTRRLNQAAADIAGTGEKIEFPTVSPETAEAYRAQADEQTKLIEQGRIALEAYNLVFGENLILTGDVAEAEERLADIREKALDRITQTELDRAQVAVRAQEMTAEERRKEIDSNAEAITVLENFIATNALGTETVQALNDQITDLQNSTVELTDVTLSYADVLKQLEDQQTALTSQTDAYFESLTLEVAARDELTRLTHENTAAEAESAAKRQELISTANEQRTEIETADAEKRAEIAASAAEQRQKIDTDGAERRAKILRDYNISASNAIANRDALALVLARQTRDKELDDQQKAYDKALKELDKATQKQLDTQAKALDKQERALDRSLEKQLRQFDAAAAKEAQKRADAYRRTEFDLEQAQVNQRAIAQNAQQLRLIQEFNHQNALVALAYNAGVATRAIAQNTFDFIKGIAAQVQGTSGVATISNLSEGAHYNVGDTYRDASGLLYVWTGTTWQRAYAQMGAGGGTNPLSADLGTGTDFLNRGTAFANRVLPTFAAGSRYITHDQIAIVHRGERVLSAQENRAGGQTVNINANFKSVDDEATWRYVRRRFMEAVRTSA